MHEPPPALPAVGVVLAGGASQRMGTDKALLEVAGRPMLARVVDALAAVTERVLVAGRAEIPDGIAATPVPDPAGAERTGPLTGLVAAAHAAPHAMLVVVGCDQAQARSETLAGLLAAARGRDGAAARVAGMVQPLGAVYAADAVATAAEASPAHVRALGERLDLAILEQGEWRAFGEDGRTWESIDTPGDVTRVEARLAEEQVVEEWWRRLGAAMPGGVVALDPALRADLLAIAKVAADASVRWAAPLTTFAAGAAISKDAGTPELRATVAALRARLEEKP